MQLKHVSKTVPSRAFGVGWGRGGGGVSSSKHKTLGRALASTLTSCSCPITCSGQKDMKHVLMGGLSLVGIRLGLLCPVPAKERAKGSGRAVVLGTSLFPSAGSSFSCFLRFHIYDTSFSLELPAPIMGSLGLLTYHKMGMVAL